MADELTIARGPVTNMAIHALRIQGFRSLRDVRWRPGSLNVVIGPNGSGKTNLLRSLELLRDSARRDLPESIVREGGLSAVLWDGRSRSCDWSVTFDRPANHGVRARRRYRYDLSLQSDPTHGYRLSREELFNLAGRSEARMALAGSGRGSKIRTGPPSRKAGGDAAPGAYDQTRLSQLGPHPAGEPFEVQTHLASWRFYGAMDVGRSARVRQAAVPRFDGGIDEDGQNLIPFLHARYTGAERFRDDLESAMRAAYGEDFKELLFPPAADQRIQLRVRWKTLQRDQSASDLSDGMLRFLLLLAVLADPEPGGLIAIEDPDHGLHPAMLPVVAEFAAQAATHTQVVFTTHSTAFLNAIGAHSPVVTVSHWSGGQTDLQTPGPKELRRWLSEYTLGELFASGELEELG